MCLNEKGIFIVEITKVIASGLPESALRKIFYDNARRLLNI